MSSSAAETRSHSAMFKRAKQLEHWNESDTHRASTEPRTGRAVSRVKGHRQIQGWNIVSDHDFKRRFVQCDAAVHLCLPVPGAPHAYWKKNFKILLYNYILMCDLIHVKFHESLSLTIFLGGILDHIRSCMLIFLRTQTQFRITYDQKALF